MSKASIINGLNQQEMEEEQQESNDETVVMGAEQTILIDPKEKSSPVIVEKEQNDDPQSILSAGIEDISALLENHYSVTDIFRLCMEVMQRAFKFDHAVVCMVNNSIKTMEAKFGYGINNAFLGQFKFPLKYKMDVFHLALDKGIDICISDSTDEKITKKIPAWYQQIIEAESFIILPIMIKKKPIGLFYGDRFQANDLVIKQQELKLLQKLKGLASEALLKKYQR